LAPAIKCRELRQHRSHYAFLPARFLGDGEQLQDHDAEIATNRAKVKSTITMAKLTIAGRSETPGNGGDLIARGLLLLGRIAQIRMRSKPIPSAAGWFRSYSRQAQAILPWRLRQGAACLGLRHRVSG
jgi:hypothetical protein